MKNAFLLFIACFFLGCEHKTTQKVVSVYPDGTPKNICTYKITGNDSIRARETWFYQNRSQRLMGEFLHDSIFNGQWTAWFQNGNRIFEATFTSGKRAGDWKIWDLDGKELKVNEYTIEEYPDGFPKFIEYLKMVDNDLVLAGRVDFYPNHCIKTAGPVKSNKKHGLWTAWFDDGTKWSEGTFKYDVNDGLHTVWYSNGQKYYEGSYLLGEKDGTWKFWNEKGELIRETDFKHD